MRPGAVPRVLRGIPPLRVVARQEWPAVEHAGRRVRRQAPRRRQRHPRRRRVVPRPGTGLRPDLDRRRRGVSGTEREVRGTPRRVRGRGRRVRLLRSGPGDDPGECLEHDREDEGRRGHVGDLQWRRYCAPRLHTRSDRPGLVPRVDPDRVGARRHQRLRPHLRPGAVGERLRPLEPVRTRGPRTGRFHLHLRVVERQDATR